MLNTLFHLTALAGCVWVGWWAHGEHIRMAPKMPIITKGAVFSPFTLLQCPAGNRNGLMEWHRICGAQRRQEQNHPNVKEIKQ